MPYPNTPEGRAKRNAAVRARNERKREAAMAEQASEETLGAVEVAENEGWSMPVGLVEDTPRVVLVNEEAPEQITVRQYLYGVVDTLVAPTEEKRLGKVMKALDVATRVSGQDPNELLTKEEWDVVLSEYVATLRKSAHERGEA